MGHRTPLGIYTNDPSVKTAGVKCREEIVSLRNDFTQVFFYKVLGAFVRPQKLGKK